VIDSRAFKEVVMALTEPAPAGANFGEQPKLLETNGQASAAHSAVGVAPPLVVVQPQAAPTHRDWKFWVPITALVMVLVAGGLIGAYFIGRSSRASEGTIATRVTNAVAAQRATDGALTAASLNAQHHAISLRFQVTLNRAERLAFARGQANGVQTGFVSGQNAGLAAGTAAGKQQGLTQGRQQGRRQGRLNGFRRGLNAGSPTFVVPGP
jgi:hypothetical protein